MLTVLEIIQKTADFFAAKGLESPRLNAELIVGRALGLKRMQLYLAFERPLSEAELEKMREPVRRRARREPLQYIFGETEFFGLRLKVDRRALIPRPETEHLVEIVVSRLAGTPPVRLLDLGTGSGALALALAHAFSSALVTAVDASGGALELAAENAAALGLGSRITFLQSDWFAGLSAESRFDLIVANPPYLSDEELAAAEPEVNAFEPRQALAAGEEGLADLRAILRQAPVFLTEGGLLALETGMTQHSALVALAAEAGLAQVESLKDLAGRDRFVLGRRPGP